MDRIEHMYRSLHCEYHLVPRTAGEAPTVPALTEAGFARWMTRLAQACPGAEARRLDSIVTNWRIECPLPSLRRSPGPVPKHLPPTLPRNMFPPHPNIHVEDEVITAYHEARRFRSRSPPRHRRAAATEARRHSARFDSPPPRKKYTEDDEDYERLRRHLRRGGSPPPQRRDRDSRRYAYEDHDLEYDVPTRRGKGSKHDRSSTKNSDKRSSRAKGKDRTRDRSPSPSRNRRKDPFSRFFGEGVSNLQPGRHLVEKDRYGRTRYRKLSG